MLPNTNTRFTRLRLVMLWLLYTIAVCYNYMVRSRRNNILHDQTRPMRKRYLTPDQFRACGFYAIDPEEQLYLLINLSEKIQYQTTILYYDYSLEEFTEEQWKNAQKQIETDIMEYVHYINAQNTDNYTAPEFYYTFSVTKDFLTASIAVPSTQKEEISYATRTRK